MGINPNMHLVDINGEVKKIPTRDGYGEGLVIAGDKNKDVVVLCADLTDSTRSKFFREKYPDRFVEMGVAEQNMASVAAGMALGGKIPFISSYAMFSPGRNWEQLRTTVCYNNVNVKVGGAHAGISVGPDGATHQAIEDVAIMRPIANMTILVPCDSVEAKKATIAAAEFVGPVYLRFYRDKTPVVTTEDTPYKLGKAEVYAEGSDVVIIAMGTLVYEALIAALALEKEGVSTAVINCHTVKPLDTQTIVKMAKKCGAVVTAEEHQITGGLGAAVAETLTSEYPVPIKRVGVQNKFGQSGPPDELMKLYNLKSTDIIKAAKESIRMKYSHAAKLSDHVPTAPRGREARRLSERAMNPVPHEVSFKAKDGAKIRSLPELHKAVQAMDQATFSHHVNDDRHDFAQWVADIHEDNDLAHVLNKAKTKTSVIRALGTRISQLHNARR